MNTSKTRLITGAGRGLGVELAKAALAAGHNVVAAGRNTKTVTGAIGAHDSLLVVRLDITDAEQADGAVAAAVERFGRVDVLVNNAGNFIAGFFEEISAGIVGQQFCSAYAAAKFGVEGWMESLATEVDRFGISTRIVEPGFFRTDLLTPESTTWAELSIDDYAEQSAATRAAWQSMNGQQGGDPAGLAAALVSVIDTDTPPVRWVAGADAVQAVEDKAKALLTQVDAYRELSSSLAHDDA